MKIHKLNVDSFSWSRWRACDIFAQFNFACRTYDIIKMRKIIRKYAVGFIDGKDLVCRKKEGHVGVMFLINEVFSWCHLTNEEFEKIFEI